MEAAPAWQADASSFHLAILRNVGGSLKHWTSRFESDLMMQKNLFLSHDESSSNTRLHRLRDADGKRRIGKQQLLPPWPEFSLLQSDSSHEVSHQILNNKF